MSNRTKPTSIAVYIMAGAFIGAIMGLQITHREPPPDDYIVRGTGPMSGYSQPRDSGIFTNPLRGWGVSDIYVLPPIPLGGSVWQTVATELDRVPSMAAPNDILFYDEGKAAREERVRMIVNELRAENPDIDLDKVPVGFRLYQEEGSFHVLTKEVEFLGMVAGWSEI